jgi:23S rRNA pseudouridine1911/1915/1917 synthase
VVYAKTSKALSRLTVDFKTRDVSKTYWAVVQDAPPKLEGHVLNYLWKDEKQNKSFLPDITIFLKIIIFLKSACGRRSTAIAGI